MKFATKTAQHYPPHLRNVATLPWEIKIQIFGKYLADMDKRKQIAFLSLLTLLFVHKF